jgi:galactokinase
LINAFALEEWLKMTGVDVVRDYLGNPLIVGFLKKLYGEDNAEIKRQILRYRELIDKFADIFPNHLEELHFFSTPGRTEIGGNHTDHNSGLVLAAAINLDSIAIAFKTTDNIITVYSKGYDTPFVVDLDSLEPKKEEAGTTTALLRGISSGFSLKGFKIGGFNAYISSDVLKGSGLSSSASIEVLLGDILNHLYNDGEIDPQTIAMIGQYAENRFFLKPCGLMDQIACAVGGFVAIDFKNPTKPFVKKVEFDFTSYGYKLLVVDTKGDHADLTDEYASIPAEMKAVAKALGGEVCRDHSMDELIKRLSMLRKETGDRAILRAMHFHADNTRVENQVDALLNGDFERFLTLVNDSGNSSWKWLQNCYTVDDSKEQGVALALAVTENFINLKGQGACRVHGGGFAGTIQVFLPDELQKEYVALMESLFGHGSVTTLIVRSLGSEHIKL